MHCNCSIVKGVVQHRGKQADFINLSYLHNIYFLNQYKHGLVSTSAVSKRRRPGGASVSGREAVMTHDHQTRLWLGVGPLSLIQHMYQTEESKKSK